MTDDTRLIQPTDRHPELARLLWEILDRETAHVLVTTLPYLPFEYRAIAEKGKKGKLKLISLLNRGVVQTLIHLHKTDYFDILSTIIPIPKIYLYSIKFFRLARYYSNLGIDMTHLFRNNMARPEEYRLGTIMDCDIDLLISENEFNAYDKDILELFDLPFPKILAGLRQTSYYKAQRQKRKKSKIKTLKWVIKYYRLYRMVKKQGYRIVDNSIKSYPWVFVSPQIKMRLDGHHRAAVSKHLKLKKIPALVITPEDITAHCLLDPVSCLILSCLNNAGISGPKKVSD